MIRSMTGYGAAAGESATLRAAVTVRSLNHRYLDLTVHLSRRLAPLEAEIKERVQSQVVRGRVELSLEATIPDAWAEEVVASRPLVSQLVHTLRQMQAEYGLEGGVQVSDILRFPGALQAAEAPPVVDPERRERLLALVDQALEGLSQMRHAEGRRLEAELFRSLSAILGAADRIESLSAAAKDARREVMLEKLKVLAAELGLEDARLYPEVVRAVERHDVSEEVQRLRSHAALARELMEGQEPSGKRLDFLAQEMMREANTIGSKVADAGLVREVVGLKSEVEKLREQVQNVE
jgi:uncharacterized protein (TIGR00255 family)